MAKAKQTVIAVPSVNPSVEAVAEMKVNFDTTLSVLEPTAFSFRSNKEEDGTLTKKDDLILLLQVPTVEGIKQILDGDDVKQRDLLMDAVRAVLINEARNCINENKDVTYETFDYSKNTWQFIANKPKAVTSIPTEVWEDFEADYIEVMVKATGKDVAKVTKAAQLLRGKFAAVKTRDDIINFLVTQLGIYADNTGRLEEFAKCVETLVSRAQVLLDAANVDAMDLL